MHSRLVVLCRFWPSISPFNVWDLELPVWCQFAEAVDALIKQTNERAG